MENNKWKVKKEIDNFRNLKDIEFEFVRGGITIIVGENNIGKTNLLDYIYDENEKWDQFETNDYKAKFFQEIDQRASERRKNSSLLDLFSQNSSFRLYPDRPSFRLRRVTSPPTIKTIFHHSNPAYKKRETEGSINLFYEIYYFDLATSTSFLFKKEGFKIEKVKTRNYDLLYGKENEEGFNHDHFVREANKGEPSKTSSWIPDYGPEDGFIRHEENGIVTYRGFNKDICHSLDKMGSGYLKYKTLESLVEDIGIGHRVNWGSLVLPRPCFPVEVRSTILLIDEPELFLHPSLIANLASLIKKATKNDVTVIFTTHSPDLLGYFIEDLFDEENNVDLIMVQRDENNFNLKKPLCFQKIIKGIVDSNAKDNIGIIEKKIKKSYEEFSDEKRENVNAPNFYPNKLKRLFNKETLRIFFSKKILFVEGMSDYILFSNLLRKELYEELKETEVIPIFGKWHYIFFNELAKNLNLNYWFLLDDDRSLNEKENIKNKVIESNRHEKFWRKYGEGKVKDKKGEIIHSGKLVIDISGITENADIKEVKKNIIEQISQYLKKNKLKSTELDSDLWLDSISWREHIKKLDKKREIIDFAKLVEKEINPRISWFRSDIETFLFGERIEKNKDKEYNVISRAKEILDNLKKNDSAKLNELKKVFNFLK